MSGTQNAAGPAARSNTSAPKVEGTVLSEAQRGAMLSEAEANGRNAGLAEGSANERKRMASILGCEEAAGRDSLARHFAFETDMTADAAKAALAASPKNEPKPAAANRFDQAMAQAGNPNVGPEPARTDDDVEALVGSALTAYRGVRAGTKGAH